MAQLRRIAFISGLGLVVILTVGCTGGDTGVSTTERSATATTSAPSPEPSSTSPSPPTELEATSPDGERLVGELSSVRGTGEIGPLPRTSDAIALYVRCVGTGEVDVVIEGVGQFQQPCTDTVTAGVRNVFDMRYSDDIHVVLSADNSLLWAAAVTEARDDGE